MTANVSVDKEHKELSIVVGFETAQYSELYQVSIQGHRFHHKKNVSKVIILLLVHCLFSMNTVAL